MFLDRVLHFRGNLLDLVKGRPLKKLNFLIEVTYVEHLKVHVFSFNVILLSSPQRDPRRSYPFRRNTRRSGKGSLTENAKIVDGRSVCSTPESTGSKIQYEPQLFSVAHSLTELSIWGKIREIRKRVDHR